MWQSMQGKCRSEECMDMSETNMEKVTLCGASYYEQKYYFNPDFSKLPVVIQEELQIMVVSFTEKVGGVLTMVFDEDGNLQFQVQSLDGDGRFDEIGSALEIKKLQVEKREFLESLEQFYQVFMK